MLEDLIRYFDDGLWWELLDDSCVGMLMEVMVIFVEGGEWFFVGDEKKLYFLFGDGYEVLDDFVVRFAVFVVVDLFILTYAVITELAVLICY